MGADKNAFGIIDGCPVCSRCIAGCGGRNNDPGEIHRVSHEFDRIQYLSAADAQNQIAVGLLHHIHQQIYVFLAAFTIEGVERSTAAAAVLDGFHLVTDHVEHAAVHQKEKAAAVFFAVFKDVVQLSRALDISLYTSERARR